MSELFIEHLMITLFGAGGGILVGVLGGALVSRVLTRWYSGSPRLSNLAILIPWRTVLFGLMVQLIVPVLLLVAVGPGARNGILSIGIAASGISAAMSIGIVIRMRFPRSELVELIAATRTTTSGAAALLAAYGILGSGGLGFATRIHLGTFQYEEAARGYLLILASVFAFDALIGGIQYLASVRGLGAIPRNSLGH